MKEELSVEIRPENGIACFILKGYVNIETAEYLSDNIMLASAEIKSHKFIFDVTELEYVSSAGIRIFMELYDKNKLKGGKICFVNMKPEIRRVFELVGFMEYFTEEPSMADALKNI